MKEELVLIHASKEEQLAELSSFIQLNTELSLGNQKILWFKSNSATIARRFLGLLKNLYKVETTLMTKAQTNLKKGYRIELGITEDLERIISEHDILSDGNTELITQTKETKMAFLRGSFLASGSVNHPKTAQYHLEIYSEYQNQIIFIQRLMNEFDLNAKITKRRKGIIVYLKDAEKIADFLRIIGAQETVFLYEEIRIKRDFNNSINRVLNCELANEKKTIQAANQQVEDIELIDRLKIQVPDRLKQVMALRREYQEASLKDLVDIFKREYKEKITRSGLNHRFLKIKELADNYRGGKI